jgi:hypothetical protein
MFNENRVDYNFVIWWSPTLLLKKSSPSKYMNENKTLIFTADCSVYLTRHIDLFCLPNLDTLIFAFEVRWGTQWVRPVDRWCLLLLGTWSHLWYIQGSVFVGMLTHPRHLIPPLVYPWIRVSPFISLTCNSYLYFEKLRLINLCYLSHFIFFNHGFKYCTIFRSYIWRPKYCKPWINLDKR